MKGGNKPHFYFFSVFMVWILFKICLNPNMIDYIIKRHKASMG